MLNKLFGNKKDQNILVQHWPWTLFGILLLATALRLINIGSEPYWGDEIMSLDIATSFTGVREMLQYLANVEVHPPLYHLLLRGWTVWFGSTELATRALSLLFSLTTVILTFVLGRRIGGTKSVGLIAALVVAVLPMQIEFGQEARPYALYCFFAGLTIWAVWEYLQQHKPCWLVLYGVSAVIGLYLHYSFVLTLLAPALWWLIAVLSTKKNRSRGLLVWLLAQAAIFLAFWPWLEPFLYKILLGQHELYGLTRNDTVVRSAGFFDTMFDRIIWLTKDKYVPRIQILAALMFKVWFTLSSLVVLAPLFGKTRRSAVNLDRHRWSFLVFMTLVPLVFFLCSPASLPYTGLIHRHIIPVTLPLAIILAVVVVRLERRWGTLLLTMFLVTLVPYVAGVIDNDYHWDMQHRVEEAGLYINEHYQSGDMVVLTHSIARSNLSHYLLPNIPVTSIVPINYFGDDIWRGRRTLGLIENETQSRLPSVSQAEVHWKIDQLVRQHQPQRIWLYGATGDDLKVHSWFGTDDWRHGLQSIGNIMLLDLYVKR